MEMNLVWTMKGYNIDEELHADSPEGELSVTWVWAMGELRFSCWEWAVGELRESYG